MNTRYLVAPAKTPPTSYRGIQTVMRQVTPAYLSSQNVYHIWAFEVGPTLKAKMHPEALANRRPTNGVSIRILLDHFAYPVINGSGDKLWMAKDAPCTAVEVMEAAWNRLHDDPACSSLYAAVVAEYLTICQGNDQSYHGERSEIRIGPNTIRFLYNILAGCTGLQDRTQSMPLLDEITLEWARRCTGVILDACHVGYKLTAAVNAVILRYCASDYLIRGSYLPRNADHMIPINILVLICQIADEYIHLRYPAVRTYWVPDPTGDLATDATGYIEITHDQDILYQTDLRVSGPYIDEATVAYNPDDYPIGPNDVPVRPPAPQTTRYDHSLLERRDYQYGFEFYTNHHERLTDEYPRDKADRVPRPYVAMAPDDIPEDYKPVAMET